jgi:proton-dependent oligopeptide transporter, POT family
MQDTVEVSETGTDANRDASGIGGHPRGLTTLFFTEMWERFSYYGMRALLILFMVAPVEAGGLGFPTAKAAAIYGTYTASVYLLSLPGGWVADNILGARLSVLIGGIVIASGHFSMAFPSLQSFYLGLVLIVLGTGLLKPNISTMVGSLYAQEDQRRDAGFSIFYMGINLGAFLAPLVCGFLAQGESFKGWLGRMGFHPEGSWHWGFAAAGVGMTLGLVQYVGSRNRLAHVGGRSARRKGEAARISEAEGGRSKAGIAAGSRLAESLRVAAYLFWALAVLLIAGTALALTLYWLGKPIGVTPTNALFFVFLAFICGLVATVSRHFEDLLVRGERVQAKEDMKRLSAIGILFLFSALFWMAFEQAGSSLNLFASELTRTSIFGIGFPSSWLQSVNSIFIILLAGAFSWLWLKMGKRQPSSPAKFAYGLFFVGLGFVVIAYASSLANSGPVSPMWLVAVYFLHTIGELSLSPVGLSTVTKLAPTRLVGLMMGVWFLSISLGNYVAGWVAGNFDPKAEGALARLFGSVALTAMVAALILAALTPSIRKLMGRVH